MEELTGLPAAQVSSPHDGADGGGGGRTKDDSALKKKGV